MAFIPHPSSKPCMDKFDASHILFDLSAERIEWISCTTKQKPPDPPSLTFPDSVLLCCLSPFNHPLWIFHNLPFVAYSTFISTQPSTHPGMYLCLHAPPFNTTHPLHTHIYCQSSYLIPTWEPPTQAQRNQCPFLLMPFSPQENLCIFNWIPIAPRNTTVQKKMQSNLWKDQETGGQMPSGLCHRTHAFS